MSKPNQKLEPNQRSEPQPESHYFDSKPTVSSEPTTVELTLPDVSLSLNTDKGVFAKDQVDSGTKLLLLKGPDIRPTSRTLVDVGAGYGPISCVLAKRANPEAKIWAVETNSRARKLVELNAKEAGLNNVISVSPDEIPADLAVDEIWSNPPIRIGKQALHELLTFWLNRLSPTGTAHLVVQKHLGADSLQRWIESQGYDVSRRSSKKAFRLLDVTVNQPT